MLAYLRAIAIPVHINNITNRLYNHPHNLKKEISSFAQVHKTGKTASNG